MDVTIHLQSSSTTACFALCLDLMPHQISAIAHITSILQMCCSYAETRPAQHDAYQQLKHHLDKVTFIQKRLLLQKRRRSRAERQVRVMPVILSSGHGGQSEEEDITGPTMSAVISGEPLHPALSQSEEAAEENVRPLTQAILNSVLVRSVEEVEAVEDKQAEESFMGPSDSLVDLVDSNLTDSINPEGVEQMSSFPAEMSIGSFEGSVDVDMLASVGAPREETPRFPKEPEEPPEALESELRSGPLRRSTSAAPALGLKRDANDGGPQEQPSKPQKKKAGTMHGWFSSLWRSTKVQDAPASSQSLKGTESSVVPSK